MTELPKRVGESAPFLHGPGVLPFEHPDPGTPPRVALQALLVWAKLDPRAAAQAHGSGKRLRIAAQALHILSQMKPFPELRGASRGVPPLADSRHAPSRHASLSPPHIVRIRVDGKSRFFLIHSRFDGTSLLIWHLLFVKVRP